MEKIKLYKFKNKYINEFFLLADVLFIKSNLIDKGIYKRIKLENKELFVVLLNDKISCSKLNNTVKEFFYKTIEQVEILGCFYLRVRFKLDNDIYLSERMDIKIKNIDNKIKLYLINYNYFKIKDIIKKYGYERFCRVYKIANINENIDKFIMYVKKNILKKEELKEFIYIAELKEIIRVYSRENDIYIDYTNPSFSNRMLAEYLNNYYSKFVIIDYDKEKVKEFISNYYITEIQSEDMVTTFIYEYLEIYKLITGNNFDYNKEYKINLKEYILFGIRKTSLLKYRNFYKYFDKIMTDENNYQDFMFLLETLELNKCKGIKKEIENYFTVLEQLLVKGNEKICYQIQNKCLKLLNSDKYSYDEINLMYGYRSKIRHGEHLKAKEKLYEISKLKEYHFKKKDLDNELYLKREQIIEEKIKERLLKILQVVLKNFVFKNDYIRYLKDFRNIK